MYRRSIEEDIIIKFYVSIPLVEVLSTLEEEDEQVNQTFNPPPTAELDGDPDSDSAEEDGGGYINNLRSNLFQANSIAILSTEKQLGSKYWIFHTKIRVLTK